MTRLYGRAFSNKRVNDYVPDVRFERTSVMGALGLGGIIAPLYYKGTLNGAFFKEYAEKSLSREMKEGDTLFLDNASSHKVKNALTPLTDKGVNVVFLPEYSPDLSPVELAWSKMKSVLRKLKARTYETLIENLNTALIHLLILIYYIGLNIADIIYKKSNCYMRYKCLVCRRSYSRRQRRKHKTLRDCSERQGSCGGL